MIRKFLPRNTEELIHWYERYVAPLALVGGFLLDNFVFLDRVDSLQSYILLTSYLVLAAAGIALLHLIETGRLKARPFLAIAPFVPVVIQFAFGGLFSGFLSVYSRSASVAVSWIFVLVIAALLLGNERFRKRYTDFAFQVGVYFVTLFSFFIFFLPIIFHRIGSEMFVLSGIISLALISLMLVLMYRLVPEVVSRERTRVARAIGIIFVVFNILYFTNAIPPLPLALKHGGVYHAAVRDGDVYRLTAEPVPWYKRYLLYNTLYHRTAGESAYVYTAIFAPSGLSTVIVHEWQYKDASGKWVTVAKVPFSIHGGRDAGYRGYSEKSALTPGKWRVNVLTEDGRIIGRVGFTVVDVVATTPLIDVVR
jgi:hypothetical protein